MKSAAFTLIEIMVVVLVIGLLAVIAFPVYSRVRLSAVRSTAINDARLLSAAAQEYFADQMVTTVSTSDLIGSSSSGYMKGLSGANTLSPAIFSDSSTFTFTVDNPFMVAGPMTFDHDGKIIGDPY